MINTKLSKILSCDQMRVFTGFISQYIGRMKKLTIFAAAAIIFDNTIATTSRSSPPEVILLYVIEEIHVPPSFDYGMKLESPLDNGEIKTTQEYIKEVLFSLVLVDNLSIDSQI
jgi:hypothetical protein